MITGYYFDGRSPEQKTAQLWFDATDAQFIVLKATTQSAGVANDTLDPLDSLTGASTDTAPIVQTASALNAHQRRYPVRTVDFGEPTQRGQRVVRFDDGGQFVASDAAHAHTYLSANQHSGGWVAGITLKWQWVMAAFAGTAAAVTVFYTHGIPVLARVGAPHVPLAISQTLGDQAFAQLEKTHFKPSSLSAEKQAAIHQRWAAFLAKQAKTTEIPKHTVYIRSMPLVKISPPDKDENKTDGKTDSKTSSGVPVSTPADQKPIKPIEIPNSFEIPNAMALPNGAIVLTDGLIKLLEDKPDAVMGVLAHELGHLQHRHSMRLLIEVSALSGLSAIVLGDASGFITQAPLLLGALSYSRDHEGEADDSAIVMMRSAGVPSSELAVFFERAKGFMAAQTTGKNKEKTNSGQNDSKGSEKKPKPSWYFNIPDWLSTHPSDAARIDKLKRAH